MSLPPSREGIHHDEPSRGQEITHGPEACETAPQGRDRKQNRNHSEEAVESIHEVSTSTSHDEDEVASSIEDVELRDVEASISEAPYTVFTASQKRFIALLAACAGFFSAVSIFVQRIRDSSFVDCHRFRQTYISRLSIR